MYSGDPMALTPEQFLNKWVDTHTELGLQDEFGAKSLVKKNPEDKNIPQKGKIPGKRLIEAECAKERADKLSQMLYDAVEVTSVELIQMNPLQIIDRIVKLNPPSQHVKQDVNTNFTFADMVHKASLELENYQDVEVDAKENDTKD